MKYASEPAYCGDCQHYANVTEDGEGICAKDGAETWYGEIACEDFDRKEDEDDV